jgi:phosphatidylglycerol lysyltransferase
MGLLLVVLVVLRRARPAFDRKAALFETRFSADWLMAIIGALGASLWLGFFAFKHVEYAQQMWWQFELHSEASRFLRASVGASVVLLLAGVARLVRPAPHEIDEPTNQDLEDADRVIAAQSLTMPNLAHLRDKGLLFDDERAAFIMYGVQGSTWLALGDPVGPEERYSALIRRFLERCDDYDGTPAFYEIGPKHLHRYADFGMTFLKLGEEAKADLRAFTLQGSSGYRARQAVRRLEREQASFRVIRPPEVKATLPQLREVSDNWLAAKASAEKGFSLGFFDESYLERSPVAVIEIGGRVVAFANMWLGAGKEELSLDLMRYHQDAPKGVMESLMVQTMLWGKQCGYRWYALGMAPLSGYEQSPLAPFWQRMGAFLYEHGEAVYSFQGLRAYKEHFNPIWEPRYLAYLGGFRLAKILADASALIAGGYRRIFLK